MPARRAASQAVPVANLDAAWARAEQQVAGWRSISVRIPGAAAETAAFTIDRGDRGPAAEAGHADGEHADRGGRQVGAVRVAQRRPPASLLPALRRTPARCGDSRARRSRDSRRSAARSSSTPDCRWRSAGCGPGARAAPRPATRSRRDEQSRACHVDLRSIHEVTKTQDTRDWVMQHTSCSARASRGAKSGPDPTLTSVARPKAGTRTALCSFVSSCLVAFVIGRRPRHSPLA